MTTLTVRNDPLPALTSYSAGVRVPSFPRSFISRQAARRLKQIGNAHLARPISLVGTEFGQSIRKEPAGKSLCPVPVLAEPRHDGAGETMPAHREAQESIEPMRPSPAWGRESCGGTIQFAPWTQP